MRQGYLVAAALLIAVFSAASWLLVGAPPAEAPVLTPRVAGVVETIRGPAGPRSTPVARRVDPTPVSATAASIGEEFLTDINALRRSSGLPPLERAAELDALALSWAETMAAEGVLRHSELIYQVVDGDWIAAGENIAFGPTETAIFAGLDASDPHRDNMVSTNYTHMGIGVLVDGSVVWTAHLFAG